MKYVIDTNIVSERGIDINDFLYLFKLYVNKKLVHNNPAEDGYYARMNALGYIFTDICLDGKVISLSKDGIELVESVLINSEVTDTAKDRFTNLADKLRELYPKGRKEGTNLQWRDSTAIISTRLKLLVKKYKAEFTDEQAIDATKRYIESFNGSYRYMQVLKYFISKITVVDGANEYNSQLLSFIENTETDTNNNEWTAELK